MKRQKIYLFQLRKVLKILKRLLKDFHCGKKGLITLLKIKVLPYDVLKSEEWSANILFAEEELAQLEGTPLNKIATINPERIDLDFIEKDRKSTRLNSSHVAISYAVFCLKKKKQTHKETY